MRSDLFLQLLNIDINLQRMTAIQRVKVRSVNKPPYDVHGKKQLRNWIFFYKFVEPKFQAPVQV